VIPGNIKGVVIQVQWWHDRRMDVTPPISALCQKLLRHLHWQCIADDLAEFNGGTSLLSTNDRYLEITRVRCQLWRSDASDRTWSNPGPHFSEW